MSPQLNSAGLPLGLVQQVTERFRLLATRVDAMIGLASPTVRGQPAHPDCIKEFNGIIDSLGHRGLLDPLPRTAKWGELEYGILRCLRILNGKQADPDPVIIPDLPLPADFLANTRKEGLAGGAKDERGANLQKIDNCLILYHLQCDGTDTRPEEFGRALGYLEAAIKGYFDGKSRLRVALGDTWHDRAQSPRQKQVKLLQQKVQGVRAAFFQAVALERWRLYSGRRIVVRYPETDMQVRVWARSNAPGTLNVRPMTGQPGEGGRLSTLEKMMGQASDKYDTAQNLYQLGEVGVNLGKGLWSVILRAIA